MTALYQNSIICYGATKRYRLIDLVDELHSPNGARSWVAVSLDESNPAPVVWPLDALLKNLANGKATMGEEQLPPVPASPSESDKATRDLRWNRIEDLVKPRKDSPLFGRTHELYDRAKRNKLLKEHAEYLQVTVKTLWADLRLYWTRGLTKNALLGGYWKCGRLTEDTEDVIVVKLGEKSRKKYELFAPGKGKSRGCRPIDKNYEPFVMTSAIRKRVARWARRLFLKDEKVSVRAVADDITRVLFSARDAEGKLLRGPENEAILMPLGARPTEEQVRYVIRKTISPSEAHRGRVSQSDFDNNHSGASGSVLDDCNGAGDIYEIDATEVDIYLVSKDDVALIIGTATLYLVVDRATGLIVGFYLSLEPAKWEECKQAILSICGDWKALCERFGVKYVEKAFPAQGLFPNRWVGDRGEFLCYGSDILTYELDQTLTNLPARQARKKCRVEGGFHTTSVTLKDNAQGYKFPRNAKKRQGKKYEKDACLTLDDLVKVYLELVITHNLKAIKPKVMDPKFLATKLPTSPANLWNFDIETKNGALAKFSYEVARRAVTPKGTAVVKQDGIDFKGLSYVFDEEPKLGWFSTASLRGVFDVKVSYSPSLVDTIIIHDLDDPTITYHGRLTKLYAKYFSGRSFAEFEGYSTKYASFLRELEQQRIAHRAGLSESVRAISDPAHEAMKRATKGMATGTRVRLGTAARPGEVHSRRKKTHDITSSPASHVGGVPEAAPSEQDAPGVHKAPATNSTVAPTTPDSAPTLLPPSKVASAASNEAFDDLLELLGEQAA